MKEIDYSSRVADAERGIVEVELFAGEDLEISSRYELGITHTLQCLRQLGRILSHGDGRVRVPVAKYRFAESGTFEKVIEVHDVTEEQYFRDYVKDRELYEVILSGGLLNKQGN